MASSLAEYVDETSVKHVAAAAAAAVFDRYWYGQYDMGHNVAWGTAVGSGLLVSEAVSRHYLPQSEFKTLETRVIESGGGIAAGLLIDRFLSGDSKGVGSRALSILAASSFGDWASDWYFKRC